MLHPAAMLPPSAPEPHMTEAPRLVSNVRQVVMSHTAYQAAMASAEGPARETLIDVMPYIQSWIVLRHPEGGYRFAPSKFVGYVNMDANRYRDLHRGMDGRLTERVLEPWIDLITEDDPEYEEAREQLFDFCARFGTKPNGRFRMSRLRWPLRNDAGAQPTTSDRDALIANFIVEVFRTLPAARQQDVSRRIGQANSRA